ncbi:hypothetical protein BJ508DRAFT_415356 [Ascobolus immersus RN42]|uniref:Ubiquitin-like domain-containing protein n=1 Tax=Ascobolus immersus RN42 TaxID=1160509 RepID=A0A3N4I8N7_ASCIM|nr:hypothetical protein BJ508DRAFT_415356 [Ascobolus immersus RN42]
MSGPLIGDFIALGKAVQETVRKFREGKASVDRFHRLDDGLARLERSLISCRDSNNGIDLSSHGRVVRNGVTDMNSALESCECAIGRFRKEMQEYRTIVFAKEKKGLKKVKDMFASSGKWINFGRDLRSALARFEQELQLNMVSYELISKRVDRLVTAKRWRRDTVQLDGVSNKLAKFSIDIGKLMNMMEALVAEQQRMGRMLKRSSMETGVVYVTLTNEEASEEEQEFARMLNALASEGMKAFRKNSDAVLIPLLAMLVVVVRYLKLCLRVIPHEIGYPWDNDSGYSMSITILDPLGGTIPVPQELCDSLLRLHGTIEVYFRGKKGYGKVKRGEYCLARTDNLEGCKRILTETDLILARRPGSRLLMYMKVEAGKRKASTIQSVLAEDIQICPQCETINYIITPTRDLMNCVGCRSEVRIFEEFPDPGECLDSQLSEASLALVSERFDEHAINCKACCEPLHAYFKKTPLCAIGQKICEPIRVSYEAKRKAVLPFGSSPTSSTQIDLSGRKGPASELLFLLGGTVDLAPGHLFRKDASLRTVDSEERGFLRVFTTVSRLEPPSRHMDPAIGWNIMTAGIATKASNPKTEVAYTPTNGTEIPRQKHKTSRFNWEFKSPDDLTGFSGLRRSASSRRSSRSSSRYHTPRSIESRASNYSLKYGRLCSPANTIVSDFSSPSSLQRMEMDMDMDFGGTPLSCAPRFSFLETYAASSGSKLGHHKSSVSPPSRASSPFRISPPSKERRPKSPPQRSPLSHGSDSRPARVKPATDPKRTHSIPPIQPLASVLLGRSQPPKPSTTPKVEVPSASTTKPAKWKATTREAPTPSDPFDFFALKTKLTTLVTSSTSDPDANPLFRLNVHNVPPSQEDIPRQIHPPIKAIRKTSGPDYAYDSEWDRIVYRQKDGERDVMPAPSFSPDPWGGFVGFSEEGQVLEFEVVEKGFATF